MKQKKTSLTFDIIYSNNIIDYNVSIENAKLALSKYCEALSMENDVIKSAIDLCFIDNQKISFVKLKKLVLMKLNVQSETFKKLNEAITLFVNANSSNKESDKKLYRITRGKGGGIERWLDIK